MLGIDTNVLVRFLVRDDEAQFDKANRLIKREVNSKEDLLVSLMVLLETEWVLRSRYDLTKRALIKTISELLEAKQIRFEDEASVEEALYVWKDSAADFADCLIGAHNRRLGCRATATFDTQAMKLATFIVL
jgi:predicted nucleic-acid-binding protein